MPILITVPKGFYIVYADDESPALGASMHFTSQGSAEIYMNAWIANHPNPSQRPMKVIEVVNGPDFVDKGFKGIE